MCRVNPMPIRTRALLFGALAAQLGCGTRTGLLIDDDSAQPSVELCEQLRVVRGPQPMWEGSGEVSFRNPLLLARDGGFDLIARRSDVGHPHVYARRARLVGSDARIELGPPARVVAETHDNHYAAELNGRVLVCSGADPDGNYRVRLHSFRQDYADVVRTNLAQNNSCQGVAATNGGHVVAHAVRQDDRTRGLVTAVDELGVPTGDETEPLGEVPDMESTIRIGAINNGYAWVKRNDGRLMFHVGLETGARTRVGTYTAQRGALYLRVDRWPWPDGTAAVTYVDASGERASGPRTLIVVDEAGQERARHEGGDVSFGFIEPSTLATSIGLLRVTPSVVGNSVRYTVELFGPGAQPIGEPLGFSVPALAGDRVTIAEQDGRVLVAWGRRLDDERVDSIDAVVLECAAR